MNWMIYLPTICVTFLNVSENGISAVQFSSEYKKFKTNVMLRFLSKMCYIQLKYIF